MLGKTKIGRGFKGTVEYCMQKSKDAEILHANNIVNCDKKAIIKEFVGLSSFNDNLTKPVWHSSLSFSKIDKITDDQMVKVANDFMRKAGFDSDNNQWLIIKHNDRGHKHCHIIGNRVGFDGATISDYYFKSRTVQWSKELEKQYGLFQVEVKAQENRLKRTLQPENQELKSLVNNALHSKSVKSFDAFQDSLKKQGIDVIVSRYRKTGQPYGVSFSNGQKIFKGSDLSKKLAFKALNNILPIPTPALQILKISTKIISKGIQQGL